ncbi:MAG: hypothetical protein RMM53_13510, partial [Bacteroidia bacterium]|nr:hypothetical protein [Bacteroidia bacterium]
MVYPSGPADYALRLDSDVDDFGISGVRFRDYPTSVIEVESGGTPDYLNISKCIFDNVCASGEGAVLDLLNASHVDVQHNQITLDAGAANTDAIRMGVQLGGTLTSRSVSLLGVNNNQIQMGLGSNLNAVKVVAEGPGDDAHVNEVNIGDNTVSGSSGAAVHIRDGNSATNSSIRNVSIRNNTFSYDVAPTYTPNGDSAGVVVLENVSAQNGDDQNDVSDNVIRVSQSSPLATGIYVSGSETDNLIVQSNDVVGSNTLSSLAGVLIHPSNPPANADILIRGNNLTGWRRAVLTGNLSSNVALTLQDNNLQVISDGAKVENHPSGPADVKSICDYWGVDGVPDPDDEVIGTLKIVTYKLNGLDLLPAPGFQG